MARLDMSILNIQKVTMKKILLPIVYSISLSLLSACGGGSDSASKDPVDKYIGAWTLRCLPEGSASADALVTFTKVSATSMTGTLEDRTYGSSNCTGAVTRSLVSSGSSTIDGTVEVAGKTADKTTDSVVNSFDNTAFKSLWFVEGGNLFNATKGAPKDEQGYPTQLDLSQAVAHR